MSKIIVIPNSLNIEQFEKKDIHAYIFGIENYSVNMPFYITIEQLNTIKTTKKIFISLNKNIHNNELKELKKILLELDKLNIEGIFFYDLSILNIKEELKLKTPLVLAQDYFVNSTQTISFFNKHKINNFLLSSTLTINEILEIRKNSDSKIYLNVFGYISMFNSKRKLLSSYKETFHIKTNNNHNQLYKEDKKYHIVEHKNGTTIYAPDILNLIDYLERLKEIDYIILNSFNIIKFNEILELFINKKTSKEVEEKLNIKTSAHFLFNKNIYKVKTNEKN